VRLHGIAFDAVSERDVVARVRHGIAAGRGGWIVPLNLECMRQLTRSPELRAFPRQADLVLADGMPLVWAARLQGTPVPERVAGSTLVWSLAADAAASGAKIFLLGGSPGTAAHAAEVLARRHPTLGVAGVLSPPLGFERDASELAAIDDALARAQPDLVFVALGFPKQERLIERLRPLLPGTWFMGIGAGLSFVAGELERAPKWMQDAGLEWLHRLGREPRRLFKRYILDDLPFALRLYASVASGRNP
jgi:N-acetylglucosaminyldiphosphoundecaprenol N-acetyl-beta-D-mannosaminyltransferase